MPCINQHHRAQHNPASAYQYLPKLPYTLPHLAITDHYPQEHTPQYHTSPELPIRASHELTKTAYTITHRSGPGRSPHHITAPNISSQHLNCHYLHYTTPHHPNATYQNVPSHSCLVMEFHRLNYQYCVTYIKFNL